ncbi:MAG: hypothetical protein MJZ94_07170 [Bacteroidales bacterium]|nr:hypothetical protein [Bacteroidales bacterium]
MTKRKTKFDTCFFERYAMFSLVKLFGSRYLGLTCSDRPDLQDDENGIGIEVTRAISENKVDAHALINDMAGKPVMKIDPDDLKRIQESGYSFGLDSTYSMGNREYDYWALALPMKRILLSKIQKVSNGFYGNYNEFGLYVFTNYDLVAEEVNEIIGFVTEAQRDLEKHYDRLFITQIDTLFDCDLKKGHFDCFPIDSELRKQFYHYACLK